MTPSDCIDHGKKGTYYSAYCKRLGKNIGLHRQVLAEKLGVNVEDMDGVAMHHSTVSRIRNGKSK